MQTPISSTVSVHCLFTPYAETTLFSHCHLRNPTPTPVVLVANQTVTVARDRRLFIARERRLDASCLALTISSNNPLELWRKMHSRIRSHVRALLHLTLGQLAHSPLPPTRQHSNTTPLGLQVSTTTQAHALMSYMMTLSVPRRRISAYRAFVAPTIPSDPLGHLKAMMACTNSGWVYLRYRWRKTIIATEVCTPLI
jgi:hypothetical protein